MKSTLLAVALFSSLTVVAKSTYQQSQESMGRNAQQLLSLLKATGATGIKCISSNKEKNTLTIKAGQNFEDKTGIVVESDSYSYGTDQIGELRAQDSLLINWGEEGNYHLMVPTYAWALFSASSVDKPKFTNDEAIGAIISERETVEPVKCKLVRL